MSAVGVFRMLHLARLVATAALGLTSGTVMHGAGSAVVAAEVLPLPSDEGPERYIALAPGATPYDVRAILPLPDGRALVGGAFASFVDGAGARSGPGLALVSEDGSIVPASSFDLGLDGGIDRLFLRRDGSIVLAGSFTQVAGLVRRGLALLRPDLTADPDWNPYRGSDPVTTERIHAIAEDSAGRVYIGGTFKAFGGNPWISHLARLRRNGVVDASYVPTVDGFVYALAMEPDDQLLAGGTFGNFEGRPFFARLQPDGSRDRSFAPVTPRLYAVILRPDGRIIAGGGDGFLRGFLPNGDLDPAFRGGTTLFDRDVTGLALQNNGRLVVTGFFTSVAGVARLYMARLETDGSVDGQFAEGTTFSHSSLTPELEALALDREGHVWIGGDFNRYRSSTAAAGLVVLNGDAVDLKIAREPDDRFAEEGRPVTLEVQAVGTTSLSYRWSKDGVPLDDGGGYSGTTTAFLAIASLDADKVGSYSVEVTNASGSLRSREARVEMLAAPEVVLSPADMEPDLGTVALLDIVARGAGELTYSWSKDGVPLENGPRIAGASTPMLDVLGLTHSDSGTYRLTIANAFGEAVAPVEVKVVRRPGQWFLGTARPTFNNQVRTFLPFKDGSVLVGGSFNFATSRDSVSSGTPLVRILADGRIDMDFFRLFVDGGSIEDVAMDSRGRLYVVGNLIRAGLFEDIVRLRPVDSPVRFEIDPTFVPPKVDNMVQDVVIDSRDRPWVSGRFSTIAGQNGLGYVARLDPETGGIDTSFRSWAGHTVNGVVPDPDGGAWIAGYFQDWGSARHLVRVDDAGTRTSLASISPGMAISQILKVGDMLVAGGNSQPWFQAYDASTGGLLASPSLGATLPVKPVNAIDLDARGRILLGGATFPLGLDTDNNLVRLYPTGVRDSSFTLGQGINGGVEAILVRDDGTIWIGGSFSRFRGREVGYFVVLNGDAPPVPGGLESFLLNAGLRGEDTMAWADSDRDGLPNGLEFVVGGDPRVASRAFAPVSGMRRLELADGVESPGDYLVVSFRVRKGLAGVTSSVEFAPDAQALIAGRGMAAVLLDATADPEDPDGFERRTWRSAEPIGSTSASFMRVRIELPLP